MSVASSERVPGHERGPILGGRAAADKAAGCGRSSQAPPPGERGAQARGAAGAWRDAAAGDGLQSLSLRYLMLLRLITFGGLLAIVGLGHLALDVAAPLSALAALALAMAGLSLHGWHLIRERRSVSERYFLFHVLADVVAMGLLLAATGGWTNPLATLLLMPVAAAAAALRARYTWTVTGAAGLAYSLLGLVHSPMAPHGPDARGFDVHLWGMWLGFLLSAALVASFVARIGASLREHDRLLSQAREESLRTERLVALGTLATGTAHELGTPLSTMAVLTRELADEYTHKPELRRSLELLRAQVERCKTILARMASDAGAAQADSGGRMPLADFVTGVIAEWREIRPGAFAKTRLHGPRPGPPIIAERTLVQAIHNVLNNAADASPQAVLVRAHWSEAHLEFEVVDRGPGLDPRILSHAALPPAAGSPGGKGMGIGLFLARSTVTRLGGRLEIGAPRGGGTRVVIHLPIAPLLASPEP